MSDRVYVVFFFKYDSLTPQNGHFFTSKQRLLQIESDSEVDDFNC